MISIQGVGKLLGQKELFRDVSFHIRPGDRIGLIGPNGAGKTTLFHILLGDIEPDEGVAARMKGLRLGYLPQQWTPAEGKTVIAHTMDVDGELRALKEELEALQQTGPDDLAGTTERAMLHAQLLERMEHLGGYDLESRARKILAGLGFREDGMERPVTALSGGWVMRLELARLLLSEPDLLLLDEPTNHLDLDSLLWLEQYLVGSSSAMLIISHDRIFLNRIVRRVFEIEQGRLEEYAGNYDAYIEEKVKRQEIRLSSYKNQQDRIRQMERFIERNRSRASTAKRAQSRLKLLERIDPLDAPLSQQDEMRLEFPEPVRSGKIPVELQNVSKAYGDRVIYTNLSFNIERGDRIAFIGENGAGKSTLLKMLAGVEDPTGGKRIVGHNAVLGYYAQYQWEQLRPELTVLEEASSVSGDLPQSRLRGLLGGFLFRGEEVLKRVSVLSGGEKARLILCKLLLQRPNALLLDEPTNHLDIPSREVLEDALAEFPGTVCFISHDRHFINAVANKILLVRPGGELHLFLGTYDDYQEIWKPRLEGEVPEKESGRQNGGESGDAARQNKKRVEAESRNELYRLKKPLMKRVEAVETLLEKVQSEIDAVVRCLADPETYKDGSRVQTLQKEHADLRRRADELTLEWEEKSLAVEELEADFRQSRRDV